MTHDAGDLRIGELLRDRRAELRVGLVVFAHQLELDRLTADLEVLGGGLLDRESRAVLVVLAEVRDAAGQRAGVPDLDGDAVVCGVRRLARLRPLSSVLPLAAAVSGDERGANQYGSRASV